MQRILSFGLLVGVLATGSVQAQEEGADPPAPEAETEATEEEAPPAKVEAPAPTGEADAETIRLRSLEERVNDLKEKIFRSKARLMLLRETVLSGAISGAKATIVHKNEMGAGFKLERVFYALDGAPILNKAAEDGAEIDDDEQIKLFDGSIVPGNHLISVELVFRGSGYGVFSYVKGYLFRIKSSYAFTAEEGKATTIWVVPYEKGGITTDLKDRPAIRYDVTVKSITEGSEGAAPDSAP